MSMNSRKRMGVIAAVAAAIIAANHARHKSPEHEAPAPAPAQGAASAQANVKPAPPRTWQFGKLTLTACDLGQPNSGLSTAAWCGALEVPENRAEPQGRKIALKLAVLRSSAQVASPDMLAFLAGGPGQAATDYAGQIGAMLDPLRAHRDILLLDQRGVGGSNALDCKADDKADADDGVGFDPDKLRAAAADCLKQVQSHADPRYYTTTDAVEDLDEVRRALGVPQFDLVGVSYGTRVAQQYAMRHPDAVRSVVLDSTVPNSVVLGEDFARNLDDALKAQFARCESDAACKQRFGNPYQTLIQLRDALRANPHPVSFRDPQSYQTVQRVLSEDSLVSVVRMFAYSPVTAALLPLSIDAAAHGDVGPLLGQAKLLTVDMADLAGSGMSYSIICSEDADLLTARPQDANTLLGTHMVDAYKAICSAWPRGTRPADFHQPLKTDKPVLLLAGQYDPVTPPRYADEVAKSLTDARVLLFKGQGHSVLATGCGPQLVQHFVEKLDPKTMDASCLDRLQQQPFFIDFNGATP
ncbi:alpha/beta hydrolase [Rhodanobacter sp. DHB23]|uniref:alpha/beta hydrolase n=1 Tax=Rhodanobacter sp. DHB23 TaxID=2775923 RepID=UPI00178738FB|nr:alpha/beta hydrolase [Rhodanobacter sp. DHB23]MBD8874250.1 alpha/beta fold hydrolase [Rhodanobacter sp. DHB23]